MLTTIFNLYSRIARVWSNEGTTKYPVLSKKYRVGQDGNKALQISNNNIKN